MMKITLLRIIITIDYKDDDDDDDGVGSGGGDTLL